MAEFVPAALSGVWRREVLTAPGRRDETTRVFWLQTRSWYADIRVKADRPRRPVRDFTDYDDAELVQLAGSQGFCGQLTASDDTCLWRRDLDYQPPGDDLDEARYRIDGDVMVEDGIHADYQEIWRRLAQGPTPLAAFRLTDDSGAPGRHGLLVVAGDHFIEVQDRPRTPPLQRGATLAQVVEEALKAGRRADAIDALSFRICFGHRERREWTVALSTWPWMEGGRLFADEAVSFAPASGVLTRRSREGVQIWTLLDATEDAQDLTFG
jgi:hypothetical protein